MIRLWLMVAAVIAANAASAQVFECTDAKGAKQFAQFCPPGTVQQRQVVKGSEGGEPPGTSATPPKTIEMLDAEFRKRMLERQDAETRAAQEKAQAEESERNCLEARGQLRAVQDGQRMARVDPVTGERIQYGDEERADEAERQRKAIAQWCR